MENTEQTPMTYRVFMLIRHYHAMYSQMMDAAAAIVTGMRDTGHTARVVDYRSGKYITVQVDGRDFRIIKTPGWHYYDVIELNGGNAHE